MRLLILAMLILSTGCATIDSSHYLPVNTYNNLYTHDEDPREQIAEADVIGFWRNFKERGAKALPSIGKDVLISVFWAYVLSEAVDEIRSVVDEVSQEEEGL